MRFLNVLICFDYFMCFLTIVMEYYYILVVLLFNEWRKVIVCIYRSLHDIQRSYFYIYFNYQSKKLKQQEVSFPPIQDFFKKNSIQLIPFKTVSAISSSSALIKAFKVTPLLALLTNLIKAPILSPFIVLPNNFKV